MTQLMTRAMLSEHYKAIRQRLGDPRTIRPTIPIERIRPAQLPPVPEPAPEPVIPATPTPLPPPKPNARAYVKILHDVATRHDMTPDDVIGKCRSPRYVKARQEAFYLLRAAGYSMLQIGRFCNRDHTTVLHGANKYEAMLKGEQYDRQKQKI